MIHAIFVTVCLGEPPSGNPFLRGLTGDDRRTALRMLRDGADTAAFTFWRATPRGTFHRVSRNEITWEE